MSKADESLDLCSVITFAEMSGISVEEAIGWVDNGTIPSLKLADFRMVNLARLREDLLKGKTAFKEGDYSHV
ncbi:hypothetical protein I0D00_15540 [Pseudomonas lalucatii]|uniref:DNA-binding protein n=1 Tax=Pseudomonas lalucatii TaxID=1424203 RepID=A0ABS5Q3L8_9PSED|nr:hypothetical protein [Pseudomonas lalucatii]MBS7663342.1 hypothetical protein [Pseudomonas lalucatii]MBS7724973.1 hypothetical protein [Pseudomonas lalucatii]QVM87063.1 hypothetical protein I0D68_16500 [Pseudomonas lalucatii]